MYLGPNQALHLGPYLVLSSSLRLTLIPHPSNQSVTHIHTPYCAPRHGQGVGRRHGLPGRAAAAQPAGGHVGRGRRLREAPPGQRLEVRAAGRGRPPPPTRSLPRPAPVLVFPGHLAVRCDSCLSSFPCLTSPLPPLSLTHTHLHTQRIPVSAAHQAMAKRLSSLIAYLSSSTKTTRKRAVRAKPTLRVPRTPGCDSAAEVRLSLS